jgi:hypothetical protein
MDVETATQKLEREWDRVQPGGFFNTLLAGIFDEEGFKRVQSILNAVEIPEGEALNKRFVEVTWFIPTFMHWQRLGWVLDGRDTQTLDKAIDFMEQRLTTILGLP